MKPDPAKLALRPQLRAARDAFVLDLPDDRRDMLEAEAARRLMPLIAGCRSVAFYQRVGSEIGCGPAIELAAAAGLVTALPVVAGDGRTMAFHRWRPGDPLVPGWRGLLQPATAESIAPDVFIVPLLGFDSHMKRIGQGGGFYDRALAADPAALKIGFAWAMQQLPAVPCDPWDEALDIIVTEQGVVRKEQA